MTDDGFQILAMLRTLTNVAGSLPEPTTVSLYRSGTILLQVQTDDDVRRYGERFGVAVEPKSYSGQAWLDVTLPRNALTGMPEITVIGPSQPIVVDHALKPETAA